MKANILLLHGKANIGFDFKQIFASCNACFRAILQGIMRLISRNT